MNPGLKMPHNRPVMYTDAHGRNRPLSKSEDQKQFFFKLTGCEAGAQHYKLCTPHALKGPEQLLCHFCCYNTAAWAAAGRARLVPAELQFMQLLIQEGCSDEWCHQVQHPCWHGRFDFYNWKTKVHVQLDDGCHWGAGMSSDVLLRDLACNTAAYNAALHLVRLHSNDLQRHNVVAAALKTAQERCCVLFTGSYLQSGWQHVWHFSNCVNGVTDVTLDNHGSCQFSPANARTV